MKIISNKYALGRNLIFTLFIVIVFVFTSCSDDKQIIPDHPEYTDSIIDQADIMRPDSAVIFLHSAYASFPKPGPGIGDLYRKYEHLYYADKKTPSARLIYSDSMLLILKGNETDTSYSGLYVLALLKKGETLADNHRYTEAYKAYLLATKLAKQTDIRSSSHEYNRHLGDMSARFGKTNEALNYYKKLLKPRSDIPLQDTFEFFAEQQAVILILGHTHVDLKNYDSAMVYYNKAANMNQTYSGPNPDGGYYLETTSAFINYSLSEMEQKKGNYAQSEKLYRKSLATFNKLGDNTLTEQAIMCKLANIYFQLNQPDKTDSMLQVARTSLNNTPCEKHEYAWNLIASKQAEKKGDTRRAYAYLAKYNEVKDAFDNTQVDEKDIDLTNEFEQIEKDDEIQLLKQEQEKSALYLLLISCIAMLFFVIAFLIWRNWRQTRLNVKKLTKAENMQSQLTNHLQTLMIMMEDIIFELDGNKIFRNVWVRDEKLLFLPKSQFIGKSVESIFGPEATFFTKPIDDVLLSGGTQETEYKHIDPAIPKWYKAKTILIENSKDPSGTKIVVSVHDITIRKNQELALAEVHKKLEQSNADKDRIMQVLIHDLRSPLSGMHAVCSMIKRTDNHSDEEWETLEVIKDTSLFLFKMVNSLVDLTLDSENNIENRETTNLALLIQQAVLVMQFKASEKSQRIVLETEKELPAKIDALKFQRVLNNLITNAVKFSADGSFIKINAYKINNTTIRINVQDKGIGIPEKLKHNVFDVFTNAKRVGTNNEKPFGLGLSICKQIVESHNGRIWFESEEGQGTTFFIEIPYSY